MKSNPSNFLVLKIFNQSCTVCIDCPCTSLKTIQYVLLYISLYVLYFQKCSQPIEKGVVRIAKVVENNIFGDGPMVCMNPVIVPFCILKFLECGFPDYRVFWVKLIYFKQVLPQVKWIFRIFYGAYYVHHIMTFCFLPYFSKKIFRGGLKQRFEYIAK